MNRKCNALSKNALNISAGINCYFGDLAGKQGSPSGDDSVNEFEQRTVRKWIYVL